MAKTYVQLIFQTLFEIIFYRHAQKYPSSKGSLRKKRFSSGHVLVGGKGVGVSSLRSISKYCRGFATREAASSQPTVRN